MKKSEADVILAAVAWWEHRRPLTYTVADHVGDPFIKRIGVRTDEALAKAVGEYTKHKLKREKRRASK